MGSEHKMIKLSSLEFMSAVFSTEGAEFGGAVWLFRFWAVGMNKRTLLQQFGGICEEGLGMYRDLEEA